MNKLVLPTLSIASTLTLVVLLYGCFIRMRFAINYFPTAGVGARTMVLLDGGRIGIALDNLNVRPATGARSGLWFDMDALRVRMPDAKRMFWEFRLLTRGSGGVRMGRVEFPVWIALLPCLIAPIQWARRRHRISNGRGFAVANLRQGSDCPIEINVPDKPSRP